MRKGFLASVSCLLASVGVTFAQSPITLGRPRPATEAPARFEAASVAEMPRITRGQDMPPPPPPPPPDVYAPIAPQGGILAPFTGHNVGGSGCEPRVWLSGEALLWWWTRGPNPVSLLTTTNNPGGPNPGAIGDPGTQVLLGGGDDISYGMHPGARFIAGVWNQCATWGVEGSLFFACEKTYENSFVSNGNPPLYVPYNQPGVGETTFPLAVPGVGNGSLGFSSSSRMWGAEANALFNVVRNEAWRVSILGGARYLDLEEDMLLTYSTNAFFVGTATGFDQFDTGNKFVGGQLGTRAAWRCNRFEVDFTGKIALGCTRQELEIDGQRTIPFFPTFVGAVFTQSSNVGNFQRNVFTIVPEMNLRVSYEVWNRLRIFAGIDVLYWNKVLRPGNTIDRTVDLLNVPPTRPVPIFQNSSLWAGGVNFGFEFRF